MQFGMNNHETQLWTRTRWIYQAALARVLREILSYHHGSLSASFLASSLKLTISCTQPQNPSGAARVTTEGAYILKSCPIRYLALCLHHSFVAAPPWGWSAANLGFLSPALPNPLLGCMFLCP